MQVHYMFMNIMVQVGHKLVQIFMVKLLPMLLELVFL